MPKQRLEHVMAQRRLLAPDLLKINALGAS